MSLTLLQGYSSAEEEDGDDKKYKDSSDENNEDDDAAVAAIDKTFSIHPSSAEPSSASGSLLPSALAAFSEIARPPQFLNNCVEEHDSGREIEQRRGWYGGRRNRKDRKDVPASAVVEGKAQLVGIHERVRSDIEGNPNSATASQPRKDSETTAQGVGKRVATVLNPNAEDAAELLRMCYQCGIPKTYSSARGMVCPVCNDRPPADPSKQSEKKKGSLVKDKEKSKRMKGQSSHATWKSETEMQLRQQFD